MADSSNTVQYLFRKLCIFRSLFLFREMASPATRIAPYQVPISHP